MLFYLLIIAVSDGQAFIIPHLPAFFIQVFDDFKDPFAVFVRVTDEDIRFFFIRRKWRRDSFDRSRHQTAE